MSRRRGTKPRRKKGGKGKPQARRVLMTPHRATDRPTWAVDARNARRSSVKVHPIVRLTDDGPDFGSWPQAGDEVGYGMDPVRHDDCFAAAVATVVQQPIEQVPDFRVDERIKAGEDPFEVSESSWERIARWAVGLGLTLTIHDDVPVDRDRWIGVCPDPEGSVLLGDHCLVMAHDRLVFDPSLSVKQPPGKELVRFDPADVAYGISFDREESSNAR